MEVTMKKILISLMVMLLLLTLTLLAALLSVYLRYLNAKELVEIEVIDVEVAAKDTVGTHGDLSCLTSEPELFDLVTLRIKVTNSSKEYWTLQGAACSIPGSIINNDALLYPTPKLGVECTQFYVLPIAIPHEHLLTNNSMSLSILLSKHTSFNFRVNSPDIPIPHDEATP